MNKLPLLLFLVLALVTQAQVLTKENVLNVRLTSSGPVIQNEQVTGYYFFYNMEMKNRNYSNYLLTIADENLREIASVTLTRPKTYILIEGAFNGEAFGFLGYDSYSRSIELTSFDKTLKQLGSSVRKLENKLERQAYSNVVGGGAPDQDRLVPIPNKGFIYYGGKDDEDEQFKIECFNNNMITLWKEVSSDKADFEIASEGFHDEEYVGSLIARKKSKNSNDIEFDLMVQRVDDGTRLFRRPAVTPAYSATISDVYHDKANNRFVVFGEYFDRSDKALKDQSKGFLTLVYNMEGAVVMEKINSWEEISKVTPMDAKGRLEGKRANVLFQDAIRTADGQIFLVGELYKKAASAAGIASNLLSIGLGVATGYYGVSETGMTQLEVMDLAIFEFNPDFTIQKLHLFEKSKNVTLLPAGAGYSSPKTLSYYARSMGGFDYVFSQVAPDRSTFIVNYINYDRTQEGAKNILGSVIYTPEKTFATDKMELTRKSTQYSIHRAKPGYVLVTEFNKKEKKVESRLEKVNY
ncbi:MAG: hypothetical protein JNN04_15035 [Cyclobacteriaceae bacterium]|nr:hypothetical protein [Cyclobacteriaceae bacterium]